MTAVAIVLAVVYSIGQLLRFAGYAVRDMLWLRSFHLFGGLALVPYFIWKGDSPQLVPIAWAVLHGGINTYNLVMLILSRRPIQLSDEQQWLHDRVFSNYPPNDMVKLLGHAEWVEGQRGEVLATHDVPLDSLMLIYDGEAEVAIGSERIAALGRGQFVGEMAFVTQSKPSADVSLSMPARYVRWSFANLRALKETDPRLFTVIYSVIGADLSEKIRQMQPSVVQTDPRLPSLLPPA